MSTCGHILDSLTLDIRQWTCPACGVVHDRDVNAAKNILAVGRTVSACGETVRPERVRPAPARLGEAGIPAVAVGSVKDSPSLSAPPRRPCISDARLDGLKGPRRQSAAPCHLTHWIRTMQRIDASQAGTVMGFTVAVAPTPPPTVIHFESYQRDDGGRLPIHSIRVWAEGTEALLRPVANDRMACMHGRRW